MGSFTIIIITLKVSISQAELITAEKNMILDDFRIIMALNDRSKMVAAPAATKSMARRLKIYPNAFLRMPLGFGPVPGPRQTEDGNPHAGWSSVSVTTASITFKASKTHLASYLPHECFSIDSEHDTSFASFALARLENLPWLDGRGYHHYGFYIHDVVCKGKTTSVRGNYLVVLFENRADPISSGREELGYAKVFCSLQDELDEPKARYSLKAAWEGTSFGTMTLTGLKESKEDANRDCVQTSEHPPDGILHFKYIPRTGEPGKCDVQYPTFSPNVAAGVNVVKKELVADMASFDFAIPDRARLPTLSHIVTGLAELSEYEVVDARVVVSMGQSDLSNQRAISI
jgi:Acetoacetate decarboxylase (ADC)